MWRYWRECVRLWTQQVDSIDEILVAEDNSVRGRTEDVHVAWNLVTGPSGEP